MFRVRGLVHSGFIFISRFLLKSLLQYQSLPDGEVLSTTSSSSHPPVPPVALAPGPAGASGLSGGHNLVSVASTGEDGSHKKPKKERKERGRENGKEDCECPVWFHARTSVQLVFLFLISLVLL